MEKQFIITPYTISSTDIPFPLFVLDVFTDSYRISNDCGIVTINYKGYVSNYTFKSMGKDTFMTECEKLYEKIINSKDDKMEVFVEENSIERQEVVQC